MLGNHFLYSYFSNLSLLLLMRIVLGGYKPNAVLTHGGDLVLGSVKRNVLCCGSDNRLTASDKQILSSVASSFSNDNS